MLASTVSVAGAHPGAELRLAEGEAIRELVDGADVVFAPSALVYMAAELRETDHPVAVDMYDPYHLENLEMGGPDRAEQDRAVTRLAGVANAGLRRGDFFTCASERQRDFWLGSLSALGRVNAYTYEGDPLLTRLVSVVPFGLPGEPPRRQWAGPAGRRSRDRAGRQGGAVGRRRLQLARPPVAGAGGGPSEPADARNTPRLPRHAPPEPGGPRNAGGGETPGALRRSSASLAGTCSSTPAGPLTRGGPTSCWTPTSP